MSADSGSLATMSSVLGLHASLPAGTDLQREFSPLQSGHDSTAKQRQPASPEPSSDRNSQRPHRERGGRLSLAPANDFLTQLQHEKRRADRYKVALSLVLYRIDDTATTDPVQAGRLLEALHDTKRETDVLGHVDDNMIAVLCTNTDAHGTACFMRKVEQRCGPHPFAAVSATYPDALFEHLSQGARAESHVEPLLAAGATGRSPGYGLKRMLDVVGALFGIALLWPVMAVVAAAVALTSRGPVVFKQTRLGKGGVPFTFYKFRSMATQSDDKIHRDFVAQLIQDNSESGGQASAKSGAYKLKADPRVTPLGRFIRKTSLDELPQFFNVLKGDMSLVGPRPPVPYEAKQYQPWHLRRVMAAKPGITGIWQVEGRSQVTFSEMVRMDLRYIEECSLWLDLKILFKTLWVIFPGKGAW
jgi:lipopolysaccharide/colanic/teichoic acid biosynthesis glycosyltransferase